MPIAKMKRLQVLALERDHDALLRQLERMGCVEISEPDAPDAPEDKKSSACTLKRVRLQDGTTCGFGGAQFRAEDGRLTYLSGQYNDWQFISPAEVEAICIGEDAWIELSELEEYTPEEESTE